MENAKGQPLGIVRYRFIKIRTRSGFKTFWAKTRREAGGRTMYRLCKKDGSDWSAIKHGKEITQARVVFAAPGDIALDLEARMNLHYGELEVIDPVVPTDEEIKSADWNRARGL